MGDSWDDDDFKIPDFNANANASKAAWDDEEDQVQIEHKAAPQTAAQVDALKKKDRDAELALEAKVKLSVTENETRDEKKARIKREQEEADHQLADELFATQPAVAVASLGTVSAAKGLGALALKTKQDHSMFGTAAAQKLSESSTFNVAAFYKNLVKGLDHASITAETIDEILADIGKIRETKVKAAKVVVTKKTKKDIAAEHRRHQDKFGASDEVDKYDDAYGGMEDDFM